MWKRPVNEKFWNYFVTVYNSLLLSLKIRVLGKYYISGCVLRLVDIVANNSDIWQFHNASEIHELRKRWCHLKKGIHFIPEISSVRWYFTCNKCKCCLHFTNIICKEKWLYSQSINRTLRILSPVYDYIYIPLTSGAQKLRETHRCHKHRLKAYAGRIASIIHLKTNSIIVRSQSAYLERSWLLIWAGYWFQVTRWGVEWVVVFAMKISEWFLYRVLHAKDSVGECVL